MPEKPATELQLARLLGSSPHAVELTLFVPDGYRAKTTPADHMAAFYRTWSQIRDQRFDGLIVTGAPIEHLAFENVSYWQPLGRILDWARQEIPQTFYICWAAQAALSRFHGVAKHDLEQKLFGVFRQRNRHPRSALLRGFGADFPAPVSRHTEVRAADLPSERGLHILADSAESGLCLVDDPDCNALYMFNHLEYETETLEREYLRDRAAARPTAPPRNYYPQDDPALPPPNTWQPAAQLLFRNWLDQVDAGRCRRAAAEQELSWLLSEPRGCAPVPGDFVDFLVNGQGGLELLPCLLRALATLGRSPLAAKTHEAPDGSRRIELRLDRLNESTSERIARHLSRQCGVRCVTYRGSKGIGGIISAAAPVAVTVARKPRVASLGRAAA